MIPVNNNIQSTSTLNNTQIILTPDQCLINEWKEWTKNAQPGINEKRDIALNRLIACLEHHADILDLSELNLTELPTNLPNNVKILNVKKNQLNELPETLPSNLEKLNACGNQLTHLPETLPSGLEILNAVHNQVRHLPQNLPSNLKSLHIGYNQLTHLSQNLPSNLNNLDVSSNQLTQLPETLPSNLKNLHVGYNQLTHLPQNLPSNLVSLDVSSNQLTHLPETLPSKLEVLNVIHNQVRHLLAPLPTDLRTIIPNNLLILSSSSRPSVQSNLIKILRLCKNIDVHQWGKIVQKEKNTNIFFDFLQKLFKLDNASNIPLRHVVSGWLIDLVKDENIELRQQMFAIAQEGTTTCVDRASYYFNQMNSLMIESRLIKDNTSIPETFNALRGLFRMQELEKIAAFHVEQRRKESPGFNEDIEIYLAYQCKLHEELGMPIYTKLQFGNIANLATKDLENAKNQVLKIEKQNFLRYLVNDSEAWQKKIEGWNKEKMALVNDSYLDEIASPSFQQDVENALKRENISSFDEDAIRIMNKKMADDLLYQKRRLLTEEFLKESNTLFLLDTLNR